MPRRQARSLHPDDLVGLVADIYDRVSDDDAGRSTSTDNQASENLDEARRLGVLVGFHGTDKFSASRFARSKVRPDWETIVGRIRAGITQMLIIRESSRYDRKMTDSSALIDLCREMGVLVHVTSHHTTYDPRISRHWKALMEDALDSAYESEKTSDRCSLAADKFLAAGAPYGSTAYGYERIYDPKTKVLIEQRIHPEFGPIARQVIVDVAGGVPLSAICKDLNGRGVPSPAGATWSTSSIRRLATNLTYIAKREHMGALVDCRWPALIDEATFYAAVRLLGDRGRKDTKPGGVRYLLTYLPTCAVCARAGATVPIKTVPARKKDGRGAAYACSAKGHNTMNMAAVDEIVITSFCKRLADTGFTIPTPEDDDAAVVAAREEMAALVGRRDAARTSFDAGRLPIEALEASEANLGPLINAANLRANPARMPIPVTDLLAAAQEARGKGLDAYLAVRNHFEDVLPLAARREALRAVVRISLDRTDGPGERVVISNR